MVVTPWEVKGKVDYERLIKEFGTQPLTPEVLKRVENRTDKLHLQLERKIFRGYRVFGGHRKIERLVRKYGVKEIILADDALTIETLKSIHLTAELTNIRVKTSPTQGCPSIHSIDGEGTAGFKSVWP